MPTQLDSNQVIKQIYDEPNNRIRVDAGITFTAGQAEVFIDQSTDSIVVYGIDHGNVHRPILVGSDGAIVVDLLESNITANQGTPNTITNGWPVKLTNGTNSAAVNADGSINVANVVSVVASTASLTSLSSSISSQTVLAANGNRKGFLLFNDSSQTCYVSFASTSSLSLFTMKLIPGMTYQNEAIIYTGVISAIWDVANGALRITELTG